MHVSLRMLAVLLLALWSNTALGQNSLYVSDPQQPWYVQQGTIEEATFSVRPKGVYLEYGLYLTFSARSTGFNPQTQIEVAFHFRLPQRAAVTDSWLWVGDDIIKAEIMDQWTASEIYEDIVDRRRDPSLLVKHGPGAYELRIYPLLAGETRRVKLTYLVPAAWTASTVSARLPLDLLTASRHPVDPIEVQAWPEGGWVAPYLLEQPDAVFDKKVHPELGPYRAVTLPASSANSALTLAWAAPLRDGYYLSRLPHQEQGWYGLALLPARTLTAAHGRKAAILIDYDAAKTSVGKAEVLRTARNLLHTTFTAADSFNVLLSGLNVKRVSGTWLPADSLLVESVFSGLSDDVVSGYSNLPALLGEGIAFVEDRGGEGSLVLLSSSDQVGDADVANELISDLRETADPLPPLHVVDFANQSYSTHFFGGRQYRGNEYFYTNVARLSGGNFVHLRDGTAFGQAAGSVFGALGGMLGTFDLYTTLEDGFCYSRFSLGQDAGQALQLDQPILQVGKYVGDFPFVVEASGLFDGKPFSERFVVPADQATLADSTLAVLWAGQQIQALESEWQTNHVITDIIGYSLDWRVLSLYTAFLALEPDQGGEVCTTCDDETGGETVGVEDEAPEQAVTTLEAYPNPFSTQVTISVRLAEPVEASQVQMQIFNVMGQVVRTLPPPNGGFLDAFEVTWDGTNEAGQPVSSGTYFFVLTTPQGRHTLALVVVR